MSVWGVILLAAVLGGASAGTLGVYVTGMRMPFLAVFTAHAAMAGVVFGRLLGWNAHLSGFTGALLGAALLGGLLRNRNLDPNVALGSLFSLMLGLAFLGIGLAPENEKSMVFQLLWGNLLLVSGPQVAWMALTTATLALFSMAFNKELKVLLFSRQLAAATIPAGTIFGALLVLAAAVVTVNLEAVGGLLLYSLICNPAAAALRVARGFAGSLVWGAALGAGCALGGFAAAYHLNWPVGACIVLFSSLVLGLFVLYGRARR
jgi:manganese/iron transport system permease protein